MAHLKSSYFKFWASGACTSRLKGSELIQIQVYYKSSLQIWIQIFPNNI
jgi:hypothetical protein